MERKWYKYRMIAQLNGEEEHQIDYSNSYYYLTEEEVKQKTEKMQIDNFNCAKECAQDSFFMRYAPQTWYRRKEKIGFRLAQWWDDGHKWLTKEEFKSYVLYDKYIPLEVEYYSLEKIMKHSSAEDFIKYMKDNGMTTCPMIK